MVRKAFWRVLRLGLVLVRFVRVSVIYSGVFLVRSYDGVVWSVF